MQQTRDDMLMFIFDLTTLEPYANAVTVSITMHIRVERLADSGNIAADDGAAISSQFNDTMTTLSISDPRRGIS